MAATDSSAAGVDRRERELLEERARRKATSSAESYEAKFGGARLGISRPTSMVDEMRRAPDPSKKGPTTVNIKVEHIEVSSNDPDRFVMTLVDVGRRTLLAQHRR